MAEIIIGDLTPRNQYTATAAQTTFPYTFPIFDQDVLVVQHTVDATGVTTTLTLTTDYTVTGVDAAGGGDVELVSGAAADDIITIERDVPVARVTDFLTAGDFKAVTVNREFDLEIMMLQQIERDGQRAFMLQTEDTSTDLLIPLVDDRKGKFATYDASGNPSAASGTGNDTALRTDLAAATGATLVGNAPAGNLAATDVQAAIDELDGEKAGLALANSFSGVNTFSAASIQAKGGDIASANPLVIGADGNYFDVTGTTNFASMTVTAGTFFTLQFDGVLTMTHHATNLDLPGEANITTAAGDSMLCFATGANTVHVISYTRADGTSLVASSPSQTTANQTGSRAKATNYTNTTSKTMHVSVEVSALNSTTLDITVNSIQWTAEKNASGSALPISGTFAVGAGEVYRIDEGTSTFTLTKWIETV